MNGVLLHSLSNGFVVKYSFYNVVIAHDSDYILYNVYSDKMMAISAEVYQLIFDYKGNPNALQHIHPELFDAMLKMNFIVEKSVNEYEKTVNELKEESISRDSYHLTINPTMDCNFRCWYCYEEHNVNSCMELKIVDSVKRLINNIVSNVRINKLVLSFFGGEPLLYYKKIIKPILLYTKEKCGEYGKQYDVYITTNGYLLKDSVIKDLLSYPFVSLQVPIDGNRVYHDNIKKLSDGCGTFDVVLNNLIKAVEAGLDITVRCNYTNHNINSFADLLGLFENYAGKANLNFAFHKVWQEPMTNELKDRVYEMYKLFIGKGFFTTNNIVQRGMCYADYKNSAVVNYNGDIFKCTAREFSSKNRLGQLLEDGTIDWNERSVRRNSCKYQSKVCETCKFFPICIQGCSQNVYERLSYNECLMGYTNSEVSDMIETRVEYKLLNC